MEHKHVNIKTTCIMLQYRRYCYVNYVGCSTFYFVML